MKKVMHQIPNQNGVLMIVLMAIAIFLPTPSTARVVAWPQEITLDQGTIVVYQPQPEQLVGNVLSGRAAVSFEFKNGDSPVFGAMWFTSRIDTDSDTDTVIVRNIEISRVVWPDAKEEDKQKLVAIIQDAAPSTGFEISMSRLSASLSAADLEQKSLQNLKSDPPKIIFSDELAVLLLYDGEPRFSPVENSGYERALNTPFAVARKKNSQDVYLSSGSLWYIARSPLGPWSPTDSPPEDLVRMMTEPDSDQPAPETPPRIVVATEPTELICTDGKPTWKTVTGGEILYVENTETAWLRELSTNEMYVLLSGRWFKAGSTAGPWAFVRPDQLPASFKTIPPASDIGGLRVSVPGTEEADEAMQDAAIPQTSAIKRSEANLDVAYDGEPEFEEISGTSVSFAVNTGTQVLEIGGKYYAVDNGVWFASASATGPWVVADAIPDEEIATIPPSSPVYNTTYVKIYSSTPQIVYVGYYPGYLWSFPYYGVPVYGTGWYYPPYWGSYYYPRPRTWGLHVGYNPWTGWNAGVSWSNGFISVGVRWGGGWGPHRPWGCCGGYYGGGYHHRSTVIHTGNINIGNSVNIGNRANIANNIRSENPGGGNRPQNNNIYNRPENRSRQADPATIKRETQRARPAPDRANNVYADKSGAVARKGTDGWETRSNKEWTRDQSAGSGTSRDKRTQAAPQQRPSQSNRQPSTLDQRDLNRSSSARSQGAQREQSRPAPRAQPRAQPRGGGRRR